jgi:hypothetical protein
MNSLGTNLFCAALPLTVFRTAGTGRMPERVGQYRLNADKCLELAETFKDPDAKRTMFAMATAWLTLAEQRVKNIETVDPPSRPRLNPGTPNDPS